MKSRPPFVFRLTLMLAAIALFFFFQERIGRDVLRISIPRNPTHMAVGQTSRLLAYEEYQDEVSAGAVSAAPIDTVLRAPIKPKWSVSDSSVASISEDGVLKALRPGSVTVRSRWQGFESSTDIEVVGELPTGVLPQLVQRGSGCVPQDVDLSLGRDRSLRFRLKFTDRSCEDFLIEATAPDQQLPWIFDNNGTRLELRSARGPIVSGAVSMRGVGEAAFTAWSGGAGAYPVSLTGKTALLVGDSMAEGIGWTMREKVENAGGRLVVIPWFSSTTAGWASEGRLKAEIARYNPDLIFIALGSNEIFLSRPEIQAPQIKQLVTQISNRPAYWIGPPSWKPDKGIVRVIQDNFIPNRFYNSNDLKVPRRKDGAHPTIEGYATWTDLIWNWYARAL
jgi:lysophospholipase L1-like esterase